MTASLLVLLDMTISTIGSFEIKQHDQVYLNWMKKNNIKLNKCSIGYFNNFRGAIATESISVGDVVISVPDDMVILADTEESFLHEDLRDTLFGHRDVTNTRNESVGLALILMAEKLLGKQSKWHGYIQSIDSVGDFPCGYSSEEKALLRHSCLSEMPALGIALDDWAGAENVADELFQRAALPLKPRFEQVKTVGKHGLQVAKHVISSPEEDDGPPAAKRSKKGPSIETISPSELRSLFDWSLKVVSSYSFELGDEMFHGLVPFFDMLNHRTLGVNVRLNHDSKKGVLQMIATQPISKGEELVNSYGPHSQVQLLRNYGYTEDISTRHTFASAFLRVPVLVQELLKRPLGLGTSPLEFDDMIEVLQLVHALAEVHLVPKNGWLRICPLAAEASLQHDGEKPSTADSRVDPLDVKTLRGDLDELLFVVFLIYVASCDFRSASHLPFAFTVALAEEQVAGFLANERNADQLLQPLIRPSKADTQKAANGNPVGNRKIASLNDFVNDALPAFAELLRQRAELLEEDKTAAAKQTQVKGYRLDCIMNALDSEIIALRGVSALLVAEGVVSESVLESTFRRHVLFAKHKIEEEQPGEDEDGSDEEGGNCGGCSDDDCNECSDEDGDCGGCSDDDCEECSEEEGCE